MQSIQSYQSMIYQPNHTNQTQTITDTNDIRSYGNLVMDRGIRYFWPRTAMNNGHLMIGYVVICNLELNVD